MPRKRTPEAAARNGADDAPRRAGRKPAPERKSSREREEEPPESGEVAKNEREPKTTSRDTLRQERERVIDEGERANAGFGDETERIVGDAEKKTDERLNDEETATLDDIIMRQDEAHERFRAITDEDIEEWAEAIPENVARTGTAIIGGTAVREEAGGEASPEAKEADAKPLDAAQIVAALLERHPGMDAAFGGKEKMRALVESIREEDGVDDEASLRRRLGEEYLERLDDEEREEYAEEIGDEVMALLRERHPDADLDAHKDGIRDVLVERVVKGELADADAALFEAERLLEALERGDPMSEANVQDIVIDMLRKDRDLGVRYGGADAMLAAAMALIAAEGIRDRETLETRLAETAPDAEPTAADAAPTEPEEKEKTEEELLAEKKKLKKALHAVKARAGKNGSPSLGERLSKWWTNTFLKPTVTSRFFKKLMELFK